MAFGFLRRLLIQCFLRLIPSIQGFLHRFLKPNLETSIVSFNGTADERYYTWQKALARHMYGQCSMAAVQANVPNGDRCQLVSGLLSNSVNGPRGVFIGVYDGHRGDACSQFVLDHFFHNFKEAIANHPDDGVNQTVIKEAYQKTEETFLDHVRSNWHQDPCLAAMGSCCLVGVVHNNVLYVANAGDSRAVLARWPTGGDIEVIPLSVDHSTRDRERRKEVHLEHPPRSRLFKRAKDDGSLCLRGLLKVTRAIGDVYLKHNEFNKAPLPTKYRQSELIVQPFLKAEPTIETYPLGPNDRFVIFASHGFWDQINNEVAANIVKNLWDNRNCAAKRLLCRVLEHKLQTQYGDTRHVELVQLYDTALYVDDTSVVILFLDKLQESSIISLEPNLR